MKHLAIGVAGHVDHGKTALVRALTGVETDRLAEERERGMSIVLGFAHVSYPEGEADIIDVPGHEKFIRTMIAGATGMDAVLLVIAANERIKPQTVEHIALAGLLGVRSGLVAVTKSDLAPPETRSEIEREVRDFLRATFLEDAPIVFASAVTGEGMDDLHRRMRVLLAASGSPPGRPYFYLPIDRVFTMPGHGTVVTGTLRCGELKTNQDVEIVPGGLRAHVRGIQVHNRKVETAAPGWRTAANLRGVKKEDIEDADAVASTGFIRPTRLLDVVLTLLPAAPKALRRGQSVMLYYAASERQARVYPLEGETIDPGATALAQLRLTQDAAVPDRQPFIVRTYAPPETIGGGTIVDAHPQKHTRVDEDVVRRVRTLAAGALPDRLGVKLREAAHGGLDIARQAADWGLYREEMEGALSSVGAAQCDRIAIAGELFAALSCDTEKLVDQYHEARRLSAGIPRTDLRRDLPPKLHAMIFDRLIADLVQAGRLQIVDGLIARTGYSPETALTPIERRIRDEMAEAFRLGGLMPPGIKEAVGSDRRKRDLYRMLLQCGTLIAAGETASVRTVVFHRDAIAGSARILSAKMPRGTACAVSELTAILGMTRKYSVPLLEHLDALGVTRRNGDLRTYNHTRDGNSHDN